jgi:glycosyltransferase involved in cell wall biosynthesis
MRSADVFVLPSIRESFGMVLLEALACGMRTVASASGGPRDIVSSTLTSAGLATLVEPLHQGSPGDEDRYVNALAEAIRFQLNEGTDNAARLRIARSVSQMTWSAVYKTIREKYSEVALS